MIGWPSSITSHSPNKKGRFVKTPQWKIASIMILSMLSATAHAQVPAPSSPQKPLEVVDLVADLPNYNAQNVYVEGQPYCLSNHDCLLYDENVYNHFIEFDPSLTPLSDREKLQKCLIPVNGDGCSVVIGGQVFSDPNLAIPIIASTVQWLVLPSQ